MLSWAGQQRKCYGFHVHLAKGMVLWLRAHLQTPLVALLHSQVQRAGAVARQEAWRTRIRARLQQHRRRLMVGILHSPAHTTMCQQKSDLFKVCMLLQRLPQPTAGGAIPGGPAVDKAQPQNTAAGTALEERGEAANRGVERLLDLVLVRSSLQTVQDYPQHLRR